MNGKVLKVVEYNLSFGDNSRLVDVFGCIKYKKNNKLYIIYADHGSNYNIVYYGSSHVKNNSILSMECNDSRDQEIIKEYIFKVTQKQELNDFEFISLDDVDGVEIISSNRLEVKPEVLASLVDLCIPKPEVSKTVNTQEAKVVKKSSMGKILIIIILALAIGGGFWYVTNMNTTDNTVKTIVCKGTYNDNDINATVLETKKYYFNHNDSLEKIDTDRIYKFSENDYLDFVNKGLMYQYMPDDSATGGWDKNDTDYTFSMYMKETVDTSYNKPKDYEGVLADNKNNGYKCEESIEGE